MPKGQKSSTRRFYPDDLGERDWMPRVCIKLTWVQKSWLRSFLKDIIRQRVDAQSNTVMIQVDEYDFTDLLEIITHFDNARFIMSSIQPLASYGGADNPNRPSNRSANPSKKKNLQ